MVAMTHQMPMPPASYHIKAGDTLSGLAETFYGNASKWPSIWKDNPQVTNPDLIYTGNTLKLPDSATLTVSNTYVPRHKTYTPRHAAPSAPVVPQHAAASGNMVAIAAYFESHGATKSAAAGISACIWGESEGNPESVGSGGFGLIGWTGNTIGLPNGFNGPTGNVSADMNAELEGVVGYIDANGGFGPINAAGGPVGAAQVFSSQYEKPAVMYSDIHYGGAGDPTSIFDAL